MGRPQVCEKGRVLRGEAAPASVYIFRSCAFWLSWVFPFLFVNLLLAESSLVWFAGGPILDGLGRSIVGDLHNVIDMVRQGHKQVKEQFASSYLHLHLHGSTPLKNLTTPDDQS